MSEFVDESEELYDEVCSIIGRCCRMLARNGVEISREQLLTELKRIQAENPSHLPTLLATEHLSRPDDNRSE